MTQGTDEPVTHVGHSESRPNARTDRPLDLSQIRQMVARDRDRAAGKPTGLVYFVQGRPGTPIKVGFTSRGDVAERVAGLQTGNPYVLRALYTFPGNPSDEKAIHKALAPERLCGEWFECQGRVLAFFERLRADGLQVALETVAALDVPDVPHGWDRLYTVESSIHLVLNLTRTNIISKARKAGNGPTFYEIKTGANLSRCYLMGDLKRWLVATGIPHRVDNRYWARRVFDIPQEEDVPATHTPDTVEPRP
jgi:hypothetical protein